MEQEEWKSIIGFEGRYEVSSFGRVRNSKTLRILSQAYVKGSCIITLRTNGKCGAHMVARMVAMAFIGLPANKLAVAAHKDGNKRNNRVDNLYWATSGYNLDKDMIEKSIAWRRSPEGRAHASAVMKERARTPEVRAHLLEISKRGSQKISKMVICCETGIIYPSAVEAAKDHGILGSTVRSSCRHADSGHVCAKNRNGNTVFHFRYYNSEEWKPKERIWRFVPDTDDKYQISNMGDLRCVRTGKIRKPSQKPNGDMSVHFSVRGKIRSYSIANMVAQAFLPRKYGMNIVCHRDGDPTNNCVTNLYWSRFGALLNNPIVHAKFKASKIGRSIVCIETGVMYPSIREAARVCGLNESVVNTSCQREERGVKWRCSKYGSKQPLHFRYADQ